MTLKYIQLLEVQRNRSRNVPKTSSDEWVTIDKTGEVIEI